MFPFTASALVVIFGIVSTSGQTYNCYSCTLIATSNTGAADPQNCASPNSNTPTCSGAVACTTASASANVAGISASSILRACALAAPPNGCQAGNIPGLGSGTTCSCNGDYCNSGNPGNPNVATQGPPSGNPSDQTYTCYQCASGSVSVSGNTDTCTKPTPGTPTCTGAVCTTTTTSIGAGVSVSSISRGCSASTTQSGGCKALGGGNTCFCTGNYCNSATRATMFGVGMIGLALTIPFVTRLM